MHFKLVNCNYVFSNFYTTLPDLGDGVREVLIKSPTGNGLASEVWNVMCGCQGEHRWNGGRQVSHAGAGRSWSQHVHKDQCPASLISQTRVQYNGAWVNTEVGLTPCLHDEAGSTSSSSAHQASDDQAGLRGPPGLSVGLAHSWSRVCDYNLPPHWPANYHSSTSQLCECLQYQTCFITHQAASTSIYQTLNQASSMCFMNDCTRWAMPLHSICLKQLDESSRALDELACWVPSLCEQGISTVNVGPRMTWHFPSHFPPFVGNSELTSLTNLFPDYFLD